MNRVAIAAFVVVGSFLAWYFWPRSVELMVFDDSEVADVVIKISDAEIANRVDISDDVVVSVSFLPKIPWPEDESMLVVMTLIPDGMPYSASKSSTMHHRTRRSSVGLGLMKDGKLRQVSPPAPAPGDPRCYYYGVLSPSEITFEGPCRLEVALAKVSEAKTENYGKFSPMTPTCVFRKIFEIVR